MESVRARLQLKIKVVISNKKESSVLSFTISQSAEMINMILGSVITLVLNTKQKVNLVLMIQYNNDWKQNCVKHTFPDNRTCHIWQLSFCTCQ